MCIFLLFVEIESFHSHTLIYKLVRPSNVKGPGPIGIKYKGNLKRICNVTMAVFMTTPEVN